MPVPKPRALLATATAGLAVAAFAVPVAASASSPRTPSNAASSGKLASNHVIVLLKHQHPNLATRRGAGLHTARAQAFRADQAPVVSLARSLGAKHVTQYSIINGFAATLSADKVAQLRNNPAVKSVVPDLPIQRPTIVRNDASDPTSGTVNSTNIPQSQYCSTDQSHPRLEPEALQTMHVAYDDPATPSASQLEDGSGVKVAWIADGVDINNADFQRANGDPVFIDYKDFSGEGTNAPTPAAEAFGDASSIGAQGLQTYNTNDYAASANQQDPGCYIRIQGVAPGASMVGLKVFPNGAPAATSNFVNAVQYAVDVDGVDVINESFGANPYPDNMSDPISLADNAAIAAGVTVVASTGDAGTTNTNGSPATSPQVIGVGATTMFRSAVTLNLDGLSNPALNVNGWVDDNISSLSSGGYAENGKVPDVVAPGDSGWALCSTDDATYEECSNLDGTSGSPIQDFGGTSQSSPLTAGVAALVIGAYEKTHHGNRPTPSTVKSIIVGTARDLGHPAFEQGAGEVNALAAVRAAESMPGSTDAPASGSQLVTTTGKKGVNQLDLTGSPKSNVSGHFTVRNASSTTQTVSLSTRSLTRTLRTTTGNVKLDPSQTFPNVTGDGRAYKLVQFNVPAGADRLDASEAWNSPDGYDVFMALVDPFGNYQAYSSPQGAGNFAHIDARNPAPGKWTAMLWANPAFTGKISYEFTSSAYAPYGTVSPSHLTLSPGERANVSAKFPTGAGAGDQSAAVVLHTQRGDDSDVPVSIRTMIPNKAGSTFTGVITGGNGRQGDALSDTWYLNVPKGQNALNIRTVLDRPQYPNEIFQGLLIDPQGNTQSTRSNIVVNKQGYLDVGRKVLTSVMNPKPGRWRYVMFAYTPTNGQVVNQPFTGHLDYTAANIAPGGKGLTHATTVLKKGSTNKYRVVIKNNGHMQQIYFADPRTNRTTHYRLASQVPGNNLQHLQLPIPGAGPQWLVPTDTTGLDFRMDASLPINMSTYWQFGDPELYGDSVGNSSSVHQSGSPDVPSGTYYADVSEQGAFTDPAPAGKAKANLIATTKRFDLNADSSTGDYWFTSLVPPGSGSTAAPQLGHQGRFLKALTAQSRVTPVAAPKSGSVPGCGQGPVVLDPGQECAITFTVSPAADKGSTVRGHLSIQAFDPFLGTATPLASLPYGYKVK